MPEVPRSFVLRGPTRNYQNPTPFPNQGGSTSGCGIPDLGVSDANQKNLAEAVVINIVAVAPSGPGDLRAWPANDGVPNASVIDYAACETLANGVVVAMCNQYSASPCSGGDIAFQADVSGAYLVVEGSQRHHRERPARCRRRALHDPDREPRHRGGFHSRHVHHADLGAHHRRQFPIPVYVDTNGKLGTDTSSRRFKEEIQDMGSASDGLMRLRPVTFRFDEARDREPRALQYGLVAEEVAEVYPEIVACDREGLPLTLRYQAVDAMMLNEVQKQHREIEALRAHIAEQEARIAKLEGMLAGR